LRLRLPSKGCHLFGQAFHVPVLDVQGHEARLARMVEIVSLSTHSHRVRPVRGHRRAPVRACLAGGTARATPPPPFTDSGLCGRKNSCAFGRVARREAERRCRWM
jgi:hypothetical protein